MEYQFSCLFAIVIIEEKRDRAGHMRVEFHDDLDSFKNAAQSCEGILIMELDWWIEVDKIESNVKREGKRYQALSGSTKIRFVRKARDLTNHHRLTTQHHTQVTSDRTVRFSQSKCLILRLIDGSGHNLPPYKTRP